jgi:homoserine dehydrogenase
MDPDDAAMATAEPRSAPPSATRTGGARVALFGLGTVGTAVAQRLLDADWAAGVASRGFTPPTLAGVADLDLERDRGLAFPETVKQTTDLADLVESEDVDIVVELMGGTGAAGDAVLAALRAGKDVVTANKDLVARRGRELEEAVRESGSTLRFEAAVISGVPVLGPLVRELGSNRVASIRGIFNGTTNHILSTMASDARDYDDVLREAQARGYAEADPSSDVEAWDATYKLAILIRLSWGGWPDVDAIRRTAPAVGEEDAPGITGVKRSHMSAAARLGLSIKLVARAERLSDGSVRGAVTPMAVAAGSTLGSTRGVTNIIEIDADPVGRVIMAGPGAGGPATSSAILADVLALAQGADSTWGALPPADGIAVVDDLVVERGWLVMLEGLGVAGFPDSVRGVALATTDEGFVSQPMNLLEMTTRLGLVDRPMTIYPVLTDA